MSDAAAGMFTTAVICYFWETTLAINDTRLVWYCDIWIGMDSGLCWPGWSPLSLWKKWKETHNVEDCQKKYIIRRPTAINLFYSTFQSNHVRLLCQTVSPGLSRQFIFFPADFFLASTYRLSLSLGSQQQSLIKPLLTHLFCRFP